MDNRRIYRTLRMAIKQLFPTEPKGNFARQLNILAAMVARIVQARSCQLPAIAAEPIRLVPPSLTLDKE